MAKHNFSACLQLLIHRYKTKTSVVNGNKVKYEVSTYEKVSFIYPEQLPRHFSSAVQQQQQKAKKGK